MVLNVLFEQNYQLHVHETQPKLCQYKLVTVYCDKSSKKNVPNYKIRLPEKNEILANLLLNFISFLLVLAEKQTLF